MELKCPSLEHQVGGTHYREGRIQPVQYIEANALGFLEGCVIKRLTRHNRATGKGRQDIEKAIHELQLLLELRYSTGAPMALINESLQGWKINRISVAPYHVEVIGPYKLPQVTGRNGVVGLCGPGGAVFQHSIEQAEELCKLANAGELERV